MHRNQASHVIQIIIFIFLIAKAWPALCDGKTETLCGGMQLQRCTIDEATIILSAKSHSKDCRYIQWSPEDCKALETVRYGVYGYYSNIFWTYGCSSDFDVCFRARSALCDGKTEIVCNGRQIQQCEFKEADVILSARSHSEDCYYTPGSPKYCESFGTKLYYAYGYYSNILWTYGCGREFDVCFTVGPALCDDKTEILCGNRQLRRCTMNKGTMIRRARSHAEECRYTEGFPEDCEKLETIRYGAYGAYGYHSNILWTYGCDNEFDVCLTVQPSLCDGKTEILCGDRQLQRCTIKEATVIHAAESLSENCRFFPGSPEDCKEFETKQYGYYSNIFWTYRCSSEFDVCFTGRSSIIDATTPWHEEISTSPLTKLKTESTFVSVQTSFSSFKTLSSTATTRESDETTVTANLTDSTFTTGEELTTESHFSGEKGPKSNTIHIAAIVVPLFLVIGVALGAVICIWRKRRSNGNHSKAEHDRPSSNIYSNNYMELQDRANTLTYLSIETVGDNLDNRAKTDNCRNNSVDKNTEESNYIPMDGHINVDAASANGSNYHNCENRQVTPKQTYENISSKYANMKTAAKSASASYEYVQTVS